MTETKKFDVVMAGGGVMGCATAYYLMLQDPTLKVAIVEMEPSYEHNSTVLSDGNTRLQFNIKENIEISLYALEKLKTFSEDMAVGDWKPNPDFRQQGNIFLTDDANKENLIAGMKAQQALGAEVAWLEPDDVLDFCPLFDKSQFAGGVYGRLDGTMDPQAVLIGFKRKAVDLGATFIEAEVAEILQADGKVTGVKLTNGNVLNAKYVLNSAGAWGTKLAKTVGIDLPIDPVMRTVFVVQSDVVPEKPYPFVAFPSGMYLIHEHGNQFTTAKSLDTDPVGFDFTWKREEFIENLWEELVGYVPSFDRLKVVSGWAGLYAVNNFDGNAFLGEWPKLEGFILVNGFSGHGFQQAHAIGRYLAEMMRGVDYSIDLSIFSPKRLLENKPVFEGHGKIV